jgi:hypothetical protein
METAERPIPAGRTPALPEPLNAGARGGAHCRRRPAGDLRLWRRRLSTPCSSWAQFDLALDVASYDELCSNIKLDVGVAGPPGMAVTVAGSWLRPPSFMAHLPEPSRLSVHIRLDGYA